VQLAQIKAEKSYEDMTVRIFGVNLL
jgi:hypothetical protein